MAFSKKKNGKNNERHQIYESVKKGLDTLLKSFRDDDTSLEYTFPSSLSTEERAYVHASAQAMGMKSRSYGKGNERRLTVTKNKLYVKNKAAKLHILPNTCEKAAKLLEQYPLTRAELQDVLPLENIAICSSSGQEAHADCIRYQVPIIPQPMKSSAMMTERKSLPTWRHREEILNMISKNKVIMITGDTGSGKTTQVPQYLLELFSERNEPIRIICTQPRRIAAISVAERVASERGEQIGTTVGYQIRLENRMSSKTALMFCTTGILLRTLMYQENNLEKVTHLIIDEVHERDRFVDFLLGVIRTRLPRLPKLKLILMSAALDTSVFSNYFGSCPVLHVEGKCFPVNEYFLEDVLELTDHLGHASLLEIGVWDEGDEQQSKNGKKKHTSSLDNAQVDLLSSGARVTFDTWIQEVFIMDKVETMDRLTKAVQRNHMPVNYCHSETHLTPLMVVAARGRHDLVSEFLQFGADPAQTAGQWTAAKLARSMQHHSIADMLEKHQAEKSESLLKIYKDRHDEETVNIDLILDLLHLIDTQNSEGAVLIFLPGYEEIMSIRDRIMHRDTRFASTGKFEVYTLHSSMQSGDQRRVFLRPPAGKRKIVLSTNLAETSITIDDIVFVIDTGKVKVKSFDAVTGVSALKAEWVPQASALQRKGRAGRCRAGVCYHLFSRERYETFEKFQIPEIFRVPLEELCLQSKNLAPINTSIADFIGQVPEAPNPHVIQRAVKMLQWMDALDPWENVTDLGRLLLELPVETRLGKMLLTATVLHCLDPVLTIVCCLSHRDPFLLPSDPTEKKLAAARKLELAAGTLSDHMAMLRAFNLWLAARANGKEREFCHRHFLSSATMDVIHQLRIQILDQLRKSGFVRSFEELNKNASSWVAVKACILSGLYPQVARAYRSGKLSTRKESSVRLHMTSALLGEKVDNGSQKRAIAQLPSEWMVYEEISRYGGLAASLRCVTLVESVTLAIFGGHSRLPNDSIKDPVISSDSEEDEDDFDVDDDDEWTTESSNEEDDVGDEALEELSSGIANFTLAEKFCQTNLHDGNKRNRKSKKKNKKAKIFAQFHLDDWISFQVEKSAAHQLFALRQKWQALFARRMRDPIGADVEGDKQLLDTLLNVLAKEEEAAGLPPSPEFTGVANVNPMRKNDFRSNHRRPNPFFKGSNSGHDSNFHQASHSAPVDRPDWRQNRQNPHYPRNEEQARHSQKDKRSYSNRDGASSSYPAPNKYNNSQAKSGKNKDFRNQRQRTGIAELDFMTPQPLQLPIEELGARQSPRNSATRAPLTCENGSANGNRVMKSSMEAKTRNGSNPKRKPKENASNEGSRTENALREPIDTGPPQSKMVTRSTSGEASDDRATTRIHGQAKRPTHPRGSTHHFHVSASRLHKESDTGSPSDNGQANGQPTKRNRRKPQKWKTSNIGSTNTSA